MWEQLATAAFLQAHWADNQVSCTVTFDPATEGHQLPAALDVYQYQLKGVSFLPRAPTHAYAQLPYEKVTEEAYRAALARLRPLSLDGVGHTAASAAAVAPSDPHQAHPAGPDRFCDSSQCDVDLAPPAKPAPAKAAAVGLAVVGAAAAAATDGDADPASRDYCGSPCDLGGSSGSSTPGSGGSRA
jgi:hypothetical protein